MRVPSAHRGAALARAKQTNRAEARRRYRQTTTQTAPGTDEQLDGEETGTTTVGTSTARRPAAATPEARPSLGAAFRGAYRQAHYREDLAALPGLVLQRQATRIPFTGIVIGIPWFVVAAVLVVIGFVGYAVYPAEGTAFMFQLFALPPGGPTMPVLLVGFTATRASYMLGFLIGLLDLLLVAIYASIVPTSTGTSASVTDLLTTAALTGLPTSVLFAGAAAWYRRFLVLSSPRRQQPARGSGRGKGGRPANRR